MLGSAEAVRGAVVDAGAVESWSCCVPFERVYISVNVRQALPNAFCNSHAACAMVVNAFWHGPHKTGLVAAFKAFYIFIHPHGAPQKPHLHTQQPHNSSFSTMLSFLTAFTPSSRPATLGEMPALHKCKSGLTPSQIGDATRLHHLPPLLTLPPSLRPACPIAACKAVDTCTLPLKCTTPAAAAAARGWSIRASPAPPLALTTACASATACPAEAAADCVVLQSSMSVTLDLELTAQEVGLGGACSLMHFVLASALATAMPAGFMSTCLLENVGCFHCTADNPMDASKPSLAAGTVACPAPCCRGNTCPCRRRSRCRTTPSSTLHAAPSVCQPASAQQQAARRCLPGPASVCGRVRQLLCLTCPCTKGHLRAVPS